MEGTIDTQISYKELYFDLVKKYNDLKEECEKWKQAYIEADKLNQLLTETPFKEESERNTPTENRKAQGKMTGQWTSYDKIENFDIFG